MNLIDIAAAAGKLCHSVKVCRYHHYEADNTVVFSNDDSKNAKLDSDTIVSITFSRKK